MSRLENEAKSAEKSVREMGSNLKDAAQEQFHNLREAAADYYEQSRDKAAEWEESVEEYVRAKPVKSLLIAAGVGMLLGIIWKRS